MTLSQEQIQSNIAHNLGTTPEPYIDMLWPIMVASQDIRKTELLKSWQIKKPAMTKPGTRQQVAQPTLSAKDFMKGRK